MSEETPEIDPKVMESFMKILEKVGDPKNKETYQQMLNAFESVEKAEESGALGTLQEVSNKFAAFGALIDPLSDLLDPFSDLADIFSGLLSSELAETLEKLFTKVLTPTNIALVKSLASKFADLFENVLNEENLKQIGLFVTKLLLLLDTITGFDFTPGEPFGFPEELRGLVPPKIWELE